ncbi:hypothetical protein ACQWTT_001124 [Acinetobacter baumannii]
MKNIQQIMINKITNAPLLWMIYIVSLCSIICLAGLIIQNSTRSLIIALSGLSLTIISGVCLGLALSFYRKHDLFK